MAQVTIRAGFIPADTVAALSAILATLPDEYPHSLDALPDPVAARDYLDTFRNYGPFTLRGSDSLTVTVTSACLELGADPDYWRARNNDLPASLVIGLTVSRNGVDSSAWARRTWDRVNGETVPRHGGRVYFPSGSAPTFYNAARGRFDELPTAALELVRGFAGDVFDQFPATGSDVITAAWAARTHSEIMTAAGRLSRAIELATLAAGHVR